MQQFHTVQGRLFYRFIRSLTAMMSLIAGLVISVACITALSGDPSLLLDFIDDKVLALSMGPASIAAIIATNVLAIVALWLLFSSMNRFLKHAEQGDLLLASARRALKRLGVAMILLYLATRFVAVVIPLAGIPGFWQENAAFLPVLMLDLDFLYLLIGVVLFAVGQALREGHAAKEEVKQYV